MHVAKLTLLDSIYYTQQIYNQFTVKIHYSRILSVY